MKHSLPPLVLLAALLTLAGCRSGPWDSISSQEFARLEERRLRGMLLLEAERSEDAAREFQAIRSKRPGLALGYVNEAACWVTRPDRSEAVIPTARKGMELMPRSAWPCLVYAALLQNTQRTSEARQALAEALRREPDHVRALGAFIRFIEDAPGDHATELQPYGSAWSNSRPTTWQRRCSGSVRRSQSRSPRSSLLRWIGSRRSSRA